MTPEHERRALKTAFRMLIDAVGGLAAAATCCRVADSQLARYYDQGEPHTFAPADVVADLELVAGRPIVTAQLARLAGYRLVPIEAGHGSHAALAASVADYARAAGDVPAALCEGLADGQLTPRELADIGRRAAAHAQRAADIAAEASALALHSSPAAPAVKGETAPVVRQRPSAGDGGRRTNGRNRP